MSKHKDSKFKDLTVPECLIPKEQKRISNKPSRLYEEILMANTHHICDTSQSPSSVVSTLDTPKSITSSHSARSTFSSPISLKENFQSTRKIEEMVTHITDLLQKQAETNNTLVSKIDKLNQTVLKQTQQLRKNEEVIAQLSEANSELKAQLIDFKSYYDDKISTIHEHCKSIDGQVHDLPESVLLPQLNQSIQANLSLWKNDFQHSYEANNQHLLNTAQSLIQEGLDTITENMTKKFQQQEKSLSDSKQTSNELREELKQQIRITTTAIRTIDNLPQKITEVLPTNNQAAAATAIETTTLPLQKPKSTLQLVLKNNQPIPITQLKETLNKMEKIEQFKITNVKHSNKALEIRCSTEKEMDSLKHELQQQNDLKNYDIINKQPKMIKLIFFNIRDDWSLETLLSYLLQESDDASQITIIEKKGSRYPNLEHWVLLIPRQLALNFFHRKIFIGLQRLYFKRYVSLIRCLKCQVFGHHYTKCTNNQYCSLCQDEHNWKNCTAKSPTCVNCYFSNTDQQTDYDINHSSADRSCPYYLHLREKLSSSI